MQTSLNRTFGQHPQTVLFSRGPWNRLAPFAREIEPTSCRATCPTCARLRADALKIVGGEGLDALTIERLAAAAGLSEREVKSHYATASACLSDTYDEVALSIYHDFAAAFAAERGWRDALRVAAVTLLHRMASRPAEARLCFAEILHGGYELLRRREASRSRLVNLFARELGKRCDHAEAGQMRLELLIGAWFQTIAAAVAENRVGELETLAPELESRASVFERVTA